MQHCGHTSTCLGVCSSSWFSLSPTQRASARPCPSPSRGRIGWWRNREPPRTMAATCRTPHTPCRRPQPTKKGKSAEPSKYGAKHESYAASQPRHLHFRHQPAVCASSMSQGRHILEHTRVLFTARHHYKGNKSPEEEFTDNQAAKRDFFSFCAGQILHACILHLELKLLYL